MGSKDGGDGQWQPLKWKLIEQKEFSIKMRNKWAFALPQGYGQAEEKRLLDTEAGLVFAWITPLRTGDQAKNKFLNERLMTDESQ